MGRGRGKGNPKLDPKPGGRLDRKVVIEYSSDESLDEDNPKTSGGSRGTKTHEEADTSDLANLSSPCDKH